MTSDEQFDLNKFIQGMQNLLPHIREKSEQAIFTALSEGRTSVTDVLPKLFDTRNTTVQLRTLEIIKRLAAQVPRYAEWKDLVAISLGALQNCNSTLRENLISLLLKFPGANDGEIQSIKRGLKYISSSQIPEPIKRTSGGMFPIAPKRKTSQRGTRIPRKKLPS